MLAMLFAVQVGWWVGWTVAAVVVVVAALLLLAIIGLGRRIVSQAQDITRTLDSARRNTTPMFDLAKTNLALDRMASSLARAREGHR